MASGIKERSGSRSRTSWAVARRTTAQPGPLSTHWWARLRVLLEHVGHDVVASVSTATELLHAVRRADPAAPPDIVITDVRIPWKYIGPIVG